MHAFCGWRLSASVGRSPRLIGRSPFIVLGLIATMAAIAAAQPPTSADTGKRAAGATTSADSAAAAAYIDTIAGFRMGVLRTHADSVRMQARIDSLARVAVRLGSVDISATPPSMSDPIDIVRVTPSVIAQTPFNSPWEMLREDAGLEAHEQGQGPGFASDMSIRGFSADHSTDMALWVDGVPINEPVNGHAEGYNDFTTIFPEVVSGIDVIKGPTSALYGNFAFSGVVNVRTLDRMNGTQLDLSGGNYGNYEGVLLSGFDNGNTAGMIGIRATHEDGWRAHSENQLGQLHGRLEHNLSSNTTVDLGMEAYLTSYNSPGFLDTLDYDLRHYNDVSNFGDGGFKRRFQERASIRTLFNPNLEWRTTFFGIEDTWNFWLSTPPGLGGLLEGSGVETREFDGRTGGGATSALTYTSEHINITAGGQARYDNSDYDNWGEFSAATAFRRDSVPFGITAAHQGSGGLFVQSNFDVTKYLRIDLGGRVDQLDSYAHTPSTYNDTLPSSLGYYSLGPFVDLQHSKGIFSPKTGLLLKVLPWLGVYADISRGWRQADGVIFVPLTPIITLWDYEAGLKLGEGPWSVEWAFFRMALSNTQAFNGVTTISGGPSNRYGVDVSAHYAVTSAILLQTNFTVQQAYYTDYYDTDVDINYSHQPVFNTSRFVGEAALEVHPPRSIWQWRLGSNFQGKYTPFEEAIGLERPAFALFYTSGGVQITHDAHLEVGIRNLLDTQYRELESGYFITPGEPIAVFATLHYNVPL